MEDREREWDSERWTILIGRLLNSFFGSVNWSCCRKKGHKKERKNKGRIDKN